MKRKFLSFNVVFVSALILAACATGCFKTLDTNRKFSHNQHAPMQSLNMKAGADFAPATHAHVQIFLLLLICGIAAAMLFELFIGSKFKTRIDLLWICLILALALPVFLFILTYTIGI